LNIPIVLYCFKNFQIKKVKNAKNEGRQVEFEQIVQTISSVLQTQSWFEHFCSALYLLVVSVTGWSVSKRNLQPTQTGSRTPWDKVPQYPVYFTCPIVKQVAVYL
jgi:hypothetical protein